MLNLETGLLGRAPRAERWTNDSRAKVVWLLVLMLGVRGLSSAQSASFTEYAVPTIFAGPYGITTGPDGALWFTEYESSKIGRVTTSGVITEYATPTPDSAPYDIRVGPDGALWFTEGQANNIGRITTSGVIQEYPIPTPDSFPESIVTGPDGALWFTEDTGNNIGRITTAGVITNEYSSAGNPQGITLGPDGALWFTERLGNKIGRITAHGLITEYPVPTVNANLYGITTGPDGALWFPEANANQIGRITTAGVITEYPVPTPASVPQAIAMGSDGALWFTEYEGKIGRATTTGVITDYVIPTANSVPLGITTGPDGALWFTEASGQNIGRAMSLPSLSITKTHTADFVQGQTNAQYTVNVTNGGAATSGTVTVSDNVPTGLMFVSMSGAGWNCSLSTCSRSDVLPAESSFPSITVTVNVASNAPAQLVNQVSASGGGSLSASASDLTNVNPPPCSAYSFPGSPATVGPGASTGSAALVTSCTYTNVVSDNPDWITITSGSSGSGSNTIGYSIAANNSGGQRTGFFTVIDTNGLAVASYTVSQTAASCSSLTLAPSQFTFSQGGGSGTVNFNTAPCSWVITGAPSWISPSALNGTGSSFSFTVSANPLAGTARQATFNINGGALTVAITQAGLACTFSLTDSEGGFGVSRSFTSSGGSGGINVTAPSGCPWTATASQPFITISGNASGSGNGGVSYSVAPNSSSTSSEAGMIAIAGLVYPINELPNGSPSYSCSANSTAVPIRPEGFSERVADIVFTCSGQAPPGGLTGDIFVSYSAGVTNLLLSTGQTDALLLEDEPTPSNLALGANAFRGVITSVNGTAAILFPTVPLASVAGGIFLHTWRVTNARVNAQGLAPGSNVQAAVSITATAPFTVNGQPTVSTVSSATAFSVPASTTMSGQTIQPVSFTEGFATAFQPRLASGQDPSQAGTVYNSESGYVNTAILGPQTGFATSGTRLMVVIANVPSGVSVYAPVAATNAELVSADNTGTGGFPVPGTSQFNGVAYRQVTIAAGMGTATWEVTASDPSKIETLTFNLLLVNPNAVSLGGITYAGTLAPVNAGAAPQLPSTILPVPRFASSTIVVGQPSVVSLGAALQSATSAPSNSGVGGTVSWTQIQTNNGSAIAPNVTVSGILPATWAITNCTATDSGGVCPTINPNNLSNSFTVAYPSLSPGQTGTIMLTAQSNGPNSGAVEYTSSVDSNWANSDVTTGALTANFFVDFIGLDIAARNVTSFAQGQNGAQYGVTVTNSGNQPTSLPVTVTETLPAGLTLVSMVGTGWTCDPNTSSCTRSDVLSANASFPPITVTVNVASNAPSTVTNQVDAVTGALDATGFVQTSIAAGSATTISNVTSSTPSGTYGSGSTILIQVSFRGAVTVTGTPQLALNSGGTATYSSGSGSTTLSFTYTVGASDSSAHLDYASASALTLSGGTLNASLILPPPGTAGSLGANTNIVIGAVPPAAFFTGEVSLGSGVYYLQFPNGNLFGYYNLQSFPILYHYDLGFEAFIDGGNGGAYMYDFTSGHWFYTSPSLFPYLYDFTLNNWLYYFPDTKNPGHYTTNPRYFSNLGTNKIFSM